MPAHPQGSLVTRGDTSCRHGCNASATCSVDHPDLHFAGHQGRAPGGRGVLCPAVLGMLSIACLPLAGAPPQQAAPPTPTPMPQAAASMYYSPRSLAAMCLAYLPLMGLSAALSIPGGLFMPSFLLGGSFGALCGLALRTCAPPGWHVQPGLYALCGATAVLCAVFRSSISMVVLITESCGELTECGMLTVASVPGLCTTCGKRVETAAAELHLPPPPPLLRRHAGPPGGCHCQRVHLQCGGSAVRHGGRVRKRAGGQPGPQLSGAGVHGPLLLSGAGLRI